MSELLINEEVESWEKRKFSVLEDGSVRMQQASLGPETELEGAEEKLKINDVLLQVQEGDDFIDDYESTQYNKVMTSPYATQGSGPIEGEYWRDDDVNERSEFCNNISKLGTPSYCFPRRNIVYTEGTNLPDWVKETNDMADGLLRAEGCLSIVPPYSPHDSIVSYERVWFMIGGTRHLNKFWQPSFRRGEEVRQPQLDGMPLSLSTEERDTIPYIPAGNFEDWRTQPERQRTAKELPQGMNVRTCKVNLPISSQTSTGKQAWLFDQWEEIRFSFSTEQSVSNVYGTVTSISDFRKRTGSIVIASDVPLDIRCSRNVFRRIIPTGSINSPDTWPEEWPNGDDGVDLTRPPYFVGFDDWREWHYNGDPEEWYYVATIRGIGDWFLYIKPMFGTEINYSLQVEYVCPLQGVYLNAWDRLPFA